MTLSLLSREEEQTKHKHDKQIFSKEKSLELVQASSDGDDFVDCIAKVRPDAQENFSKKVVKRRQPSKSKKDDDDLPKLSCRTSPYCLLKTLASEKMDESHKNAIREMGFSHILEMKIMEIPTKLGHWVVKHFDPWSCELAISNEKRIRIDEEDVYRVFGFPKGKRLIEKTENKDDCILLREWKQMFDKGKYKKVSPKDVAARMLECAGGDIWFKRFCMILLTACIIENSKTGYIFPHSISCLDDVGKVSEYNWNEYLLRCLIASKISWEDDTSQPFTGSALFLMVFYVDRVKIMNNTVQRNFPLVVNWDYKKLKARQESELRGKGFGKGYPLGPIELNSEPTEVKSLVENVPSSEVPQRKNVSNDCPNQASSHTNTSFEGKNISGYVEKIVSQLKKVADNTLELLRLIKDAPNEIIDDMSYKRSVEAAHRLIGWKDIAREEPPTLGSQTLSQAELEAFWAQPEVIQTLIDSETAALEREEYLKKLEEPGPSFSLGFTQEFNDMANYPPPQDKGEGYGCCCSY